MGRPESTFGHACTTNLAETRPDGCRNHQNAAGRRPAPQHRHRAAAGGRGDHRPEPHRAVDPGRRGAVRRLDRPPEGRLPDLRDHPDPGRAAPAREGRRRPRPAAGGVLPGHRHRGLRRRRRRGLSVQRAPLRAHDQAARPHRRHPADLDARHRPHRQARVRLPRAGDRAAGGAGIDGAGAAVRTTTAPPHARPARSRPARAASKPGGPA